MGNRQGARTAILIISVLLLAVPIATASYHQGGDQGGPGADGNQSQGDQDKGQNRTADGQDRSDRGPAHERARAQQSADGWRSMSQENRQMAQQRAEAARMFSLFTYEDGQADGRFVSFGYDNATGTVSDLTAHDGDVDAVLFTEITRDPVEGLDDPLAAGAVFHAFSDTSQLGIHDNPTTQVRIVAHNATEATFQLGENMTRNDAGPGLRFDHDAGPHIHLVVAGGDGNLTVSDDNRTVTADLGANSTVVALTHPSQQTARASGLHERIEAMDAQSYGGEISMVNASGEIASERMELGVQLRGLELADQRAAVEVSSNASEGKVVTINVPQAELDGQSPDNLTVTLDGEEIAVTGTASEVTQGCPGETANAHLSESQGAISAIVCVPSFSTHTLEPESSADDTDDDGTTDDGTSDDTTDDQTTGGDDGTDGEAGQQQQPAPGLMAAVAVLGLAALAYRRHR